MDFLTNKKLIYQLFLNYLDNMIAEFYLIPDSFSYNINFTVEEIENKTRSLANDFVNIRRYKDSNLIKVHSSIYNIEFFQGIILMDLLFNPKIGEEIDRDTKAMLQKIIVESVETDDDIKYVINNLLPNHNEDKCFGLIAFNEVKVVAPEYQIIYNIRGWFQFRRYFLGLYPKDANYFIDECSKYFPQLFFHERNKSTVQKILGICSKKIIYHLSALNDEFRNSQLEGLNRAEILKHFSIAQKLDERASLEGNASRKNDLTFEFLNDSRQQELVCCEPHLKLCYNNNYPGDSSYSKIRRIYFHEGKSNIQQGKILIGHIGEHL